MTRNPLTTALVLALLALAGCSGDPGADSFPQRDIKVIVPFEPGGGSDLIARALAPCLKRELAADVDVVVQNVTGASGRTGTFQLYDARPDGHTIGMLEPYTLTIAALTGQSGGRSPDKLGWVGQVSAVPMTLTVNAKTAFDSLDDFRGKEVRVAVTQVTLPATIKYLQALGATPRLVYYDGGSETMLATVRGDVDAAVQVVPTVVRASDANRGALRPIAVLSGERAADLSGTPTTAELGLPLAADLVTITQYAYAFAVPPGTRPAVAKRIEDAIAAATRDAACADRMRAARLNVVYLPAAKLGQSMRSFQDGLATVKDDLLRASGA